MSHLPTNVVIKSSIRYVFLVSGLVVLGLVSISAQNGKRSILKQERLKRQIQKSQDILNSTLEEQEHTYQTLVGVRALANNRRLLIQGLDRELVQIKDTMEIMQAKIVETENEIKRMKADFADVLYVGLKAKNNAAHFGDILSSKKISEAYRKIKLLEKLASYRKGQLSLILDKQSVNRSALGVLMDKKQNRSALLNFKSEELQRLEQTEVREQKVLLSLKGQENQIKQQLKSKQAQLAELKKQILEEIESGGNGAIVEAKTQTLYPHLSPYFAKNKGQLPWPAEDYIVSSRYGKSQHPDFENVTTQNNGIDLLLEPNEEVIAVFDGVVTRIMTIPGLGKTILIKHDRFYTVYANLESIFVEENAEISTGESIGKVSDGKELQDFHFELWDGSVKQNPELWLVNF